MEATIINILGTMLIAGVVGARARSVSDLAVNLGIVICAYLLGSLVVILSK